MSIWLGRGKERLDNEVRMFLQICENAHPLILILGILVAFGLLAALLIVAIIIF